MSNTSLVLEALQAAIEDPQKLLKEDYSLKEITHELQSCRSPSDVENDPSLYLRSSTKKKPPSDPKDCPRRVQSGKCKCGGKCYEQHKPSKQGPPHSAV